MSLAEILSLIAAILSLLTLLFVGMILMKRGNDSNLDGFEDSITDKVRGMESNVTKSIYESMLDFNKAVSEQLQKQSESSSENITEFRLNVNKELVNFQEKIKENLNKDFSSLNESVEKKMFEINSKVEERLSKGFHDTNETFTKIAERVQVIDDAQKKIQNLSEEMVSLQTILSNNQARGSFGEYQLNQLLLSVFGDNKRLYDTQYTFKETKDGPVRADAVIFLPEPKGMIAIDSKFPYSSYAKLFDNKDLSKQEEESLISSFGQEVKKHITDIAKKYIITGVTTEYAIMFVPSDGILALLHSKLLNVVEYARNKNVTIVSPTTLVPLLSSFQAIIIDFEYNKHTKEIIDQLKKLKKDFRIFGDEWSKLNRTIETLQKDTDKVNTRVERLSDKFKDIDKVEFIDESDEDSASNS
ncbi:MAG: DNA recombination protein RmuC [Bacilli bacterium]|nr:DNA recombination protein RmuC [Bacilli bacterium]MBN2876997.1 DNA recombination protein RmuC [Bacilli bacterium]